ncbi:hypothetical protein [Chitinophaga rhizosphaerae]|uniref:hypothetical protein n=1 Tax=Chitinophaga rhizosphaerae TaxID=1864947 RepID=UPI000F7FF32D|nr:hypothetical protein [Chitinophaga rhizosphaerae]
MENLQVQNFGCQELDATTAQEVNGGFLSLGLNNVNGKITLGAQLDTNALLGSLPGLPGTGGGLPGLGGLGDLLSPVTNLLNSLLGGLGGGLLR